MCKTLKKFTEGKARKFTVSFTWFGYADVIKYQENLRFHVSAQITTARIISARGHKTIGSHLNFGAYEFKDVRANVLCASLLRT